MKLEYYMIACAMIALCLLGVQSHVNERYSGVDYYQQKAENLNYEKEQMALMTIRRDYEAKLFQQEVAAYMPQLKKENAYVARNIASVISSESAKLVESDFEPLFDKAKAHFSGGNFVSAEEILIDLADRYPSHPKSAELAYLLMESYHQTSQAERAVEQIDLMLRLYPESNLSGYALIRLGDYYAQEGDADKAAYSYNYAIENFSYDKKILQLAAKKIGSL